MVTHTLYLLLLLEELRPEALQEVPQSARLARIMCVFFIGEFGPEIVEQSLSSRSSPVFHVVPVYIPIGLPPSLPLSLQEVNCSWINVSMAGSPSS